MEICKTPLEGVLLVKPKVHCDERGFFLETYHEEKYAEQGLSVSFVQDNHSKSKRGTLRGLHAQLRRPQGKLVRAVEGKVFDVAVDMRRGSPQFGEWHAETLTAENFHQLYVPPGFLHGFYVLSETAQVEYKCSDFYDPTPGGELSVLWNDSRIGIEWPFRGEPGLSEKDAAGLLLEAVPDLPVYPS